MRLDPDGEVSQSHCEGCGRNYTLAKGFVYRDDFPYAIYFAACHDHEGQREAWIDVILGAFGEEDWTDHVTFGARVGPIPGQASPAASLVQAARPYGDSPMFGQKLSREEALSHPRLPDTWEVVDFVLLSDEVVHQHVYG
jgi:hypothetical protein